MIFLGKKVVVTGAGRGFGKTLAVKLAEAGAELFISARTLERAQATVQRLKEAKPDVVAHAFRCDMSHPGDINDFAIAVEAISPCIDLLINNASYWLQRDLLASTDEEILEAINSTATGAILATKHFLKLLERSRTPDIVYINGTPGLLHNRHSEANEAFSAAKAAQAAFSDRLRFRFKTIGLRVLTIYPPDFRNTSPADEQDWLRRRDSFDDRKMTARNIYDCIQFALTQDRICSINEIILSNNNGDGAGN
ncbi:SDR family oxidoreductase [Reyranella sp.]|uniref:SDR family oxidoreductase n=1 Tax=Reyranella sp. TaxID=1929291 RepID=UPI003F7211A8